MANPVTISGRSVAPAASTVIADTGVLPVGTYDVDIDWSSTDTAGVQQGMECQRRDAANAVTQETLAGLAAPGSRRSHAANVAVADGERIRVVSMPGAGAGTSIYDAQITATKR